MRNTLISVILVLLIAAAGIYLFRDQIWPAAPAAPHTGAGGTAGEGGYKGKVGG